MSEAIGVWTKANGRTVNVYMKDGKPVYKLGGKFRALPSRARIEKKKAAPKKAAPKRKAAPKKKAAPKRKAAPKKKAVPKARKSTRAASRKLRGQGDANMPAAVAHFRTFYGDSALGKRKARADMARRRDAAHRVHSTRSGRYALWWDHPDRYDLRGLDMPSRKKGSNRSVAYGVYGDNRVKAGLPRRVYVNRNAAKGLGFKTYHKQKKPTKSRDQLVREAKALGIPINSKRDGKVRPRTKKSLQAAINRKK